jgi:hypothetical protein
MDSRRLVVWIAAGILGFQGGTLVLDLLNCSVLSWLYVRRHGLQLASPAPTTAQGPPGGDPEQRPLPGATIGAGAHSQALGTSGSSQEPAARGSALGGSARSAQPLVSSGLGPAGVVTSGGAPSAASTAATQPTNSNTTHTTTPAQAPFDPTAVFCDRPRSRVDAAVSQGLSILAGLALGGAGAGGGKEVP